jgi:hypothetical protein
MSEPILSQYGKPRDRYLDIVKAEKKAANAL